jgi:hypothetical protein
MTLMIRIDPERIYYLFVVLIIITKRVYIIFLGCCLPWQLLCLIPRPLTLIALVND